MKSVLLGGAVAASVMLAAAAGSAAVIDFTASGTGTSGTVAGTTWTLSSTGGVATSSQAYDGGLPLPASSLGLAFVKDGVGVRDDEIGRGESITITFAKAVKITAFAFLDLFESLKRPGTGEAGGMIIGGTTYWANYTGAAGGYAETFIDPVVATSVTFISAQQNDDAGVLDGALAALEVAPVPLPAAGLMLITALGGVAALRRRKAA